RLERDVAALELHAAAEAVAPERGGPNLRAVHHSDGGAHVARAADPGAGGQGNDPPVEPVGGDRRRTDGQAAPAGERHLAAQASLPAAAHFDLCAHRDSARTAYLAVEAASILTTVYCTCELINYQHSVVVRIDP